MIRILRNTLKVGLLLLACTVFLAGGKMASAENGLNGWVNADVRFQNFPFFCSWLPKGIAQKISWCSNRGDTTAPRISSVRVSNQTATSAVLSWTSNESSEARVFYSSHSGFNPAGSNISSVTNGPTSSHKVTISGLDPDTKYYFVIQSRDAAGNVGNSREYSFVTRKASDTNDPDITMLDVRAITANSASIHVVADEAVTVSVAYGLADSNDTSHAGDQSFDREHTIALGSLRANSEYRASVTVTDRDGETEVRSIAWTTDRGTGDTVAPTISNIQVSLNFSAHTAAVSWQTNEASDSRVRYSSNVEFVWTDAREVYTSARVRNHTIQLSGLQSGAQYSFQIQSTDAAGNTAKSPIAKIGIPDF